jgi:hypothetical protein
MIGGALILYMAWITVECWVQHLKEVALEKA